MFNIDQKKTGSLNDGGRSLKIGTFPYLITGASMVLNKSNPTGKEQQVVFDLCQGADYNCKVFLGVMAPNDVQREIAEKTLVAFAQAAGIGGNLKPSRLKLFTNKTVVIEAKAAPGKGDNEGKTFVNIKTIEAYNPDAAEPEEAEEEDEDDEDEAEEAPAPVKAKKGAKPAPAPAAEEEDDDEDEEEEDASDDDDEDDEDEEEEEEAPAPAPVKKKKVAATPAPAAKAPGKRPW